MSVRQINGKRLSDKKQVVGEENKKHFDYMQSSFRFGVARGHWILLCAAPCTHAHIPKAEFAGARQQEGNLGLVETTTLKLLPLFYLTLFCPTLSQLIALALLVSHAERISQCSLKLLNSGNSNQG